MMHERRHVSFDRRDLGRREAVPAPQLEAGVDNAVRGAARRERFVRDLRDAPGLAEAAGHAARIAAGLDQLEVAERAFEDVGRPFEARSREVAGDDSVASAEAHLHGEQQRALGMRLHVAAELAVGDGEGVLQAAGVEAHQPAERSRATEHADGGRPEEPQARGGRQPERGCHVDAEDDGLDQPAAVDSLALDLRHALGAGERHRQDHGHDVGNGGLVDAIELGVVDLVGVAEGSRGSRQALARRPHARVAAAAPQRLDGDELPRLGAAAADEADAQRVEQEGLGGGDRRRRGDRCSPSPPRARRMR